ncbi:MAG: hypothetical protein EOP88_16210 [Verrucomicrobiaceae bacterium]|nr:MAG: hypothetical protein EOP88_16210 [Verrucomicrobiaceae bacterium]
MFGVLLIVGGFLAVSSWSWSRMGRGEEVDAKELAPYLALLLKEDLGYPGFKKEWLRKAWVNGFQDHTYLFLVKADSDEMRTAVEKIAGTEPVQHTFYKEGGYLGPSTAPGWWDTASVDSAPGARYFQNDKGRLWRFTWIGDSLYLVVCAS